MRRLKILHVEDNREDALLLARACKAADLPADFFEVRDGADAVKYMKGESMFSDRKKNPFPDLIILDLKMPGMNGFDFLRWLRRESDFKQLPVLVFTESRQEQDRERASAEGATAYFAKPVEFEALVRLVESFKQFDLKELN